jgi:hypothetical protein
MGKGKYMRTDHLGKTVKIQPSQNVVGTDHHDASSTNINGSAGAFVAFGGGAALAKADQIHISSNLGEPMDFRIAASAVAAAALAGPSFILNAGQDARLELAIAASDKLWVRSLTTTGVTSSHLAANYLGEL